MSYRAREAEVREIADSALAASRVNVLTSGNVLGVNVTGAGTAATGDLFNPAGPGVNFTSRTGTIKATWVASGVTTGAGVNVLFELIIGVSLFQIDGSVGSDAAHTVTGAGVGVRAVTPGVPTTVRVTWNAGAGSFAPTRGVLVIEDV